MSDKLGEPSRGQKPVAKGKERYIIEDSLIYKAAFAAFFLS